MATTFPARGMISDSKYAIGNMHTQTQIDQKKLFIHCSIFQLAIQATVYPTLNRVCFNRMFLIKAFKAANTAHFILASNHLLPLKVYICILIALGTGCKFPSPISP